MTSGQYVSLVEGVKMDWLISVSWLFLIGVPGWFLLNLVKVPASAIMGAMLSAGFFTIMGWAPAMAPANLNLILQVVLGLFIGLKVTRNAGSIFRKMAPLALFAGVWWLALPLGLGWILSTFFGMDAPTALLGSVPGGIAEMSLLALTLGGDAAVVALMQFFRLAAVLMGMPLISSCLAKRFDNNGGKPLPSASSTAESASEPTGFFPMASAVLLASAGGVAGTWLGLPAGGFVGALAITGMASFSGIPMRPLPKMTRNLALLGLGATISLNARPETLAAMGHILLPTLGITAAMVIWGMILSIFVRRTMGWNLMTCLLASCPGGVSSLSAVSEELGANPLHVSLLHLVRLFTIYLMLPPIIIHLAG